MKKRILLFIPLLTLLFTVAAQAISPRADTMAPSLSFRGNLASCVVEVVASDSDSDIYVEADLLQDGDPYVHWTGSGTGRLHFSRVATVTRGHTYTLEVDVTIDGETYTLRPISEDY